jgi:acetolactate synthase-1/2/3 large subunit
MVTGIATAMMDSSPIVCITGQVPSKMIGYDAFQETDISGITLPITKHNYLVTRVEDIMPALKEAFHLAKTGRPGPVLVDITKDAQQASTEWEWDPRPVKIRGYRSSSPVLRTDLAKAEALIRASKRPVILAGQGVIQSGATRELVALAERIGSPIAMTLLGLGGVPASHRLNLGMMGMHGEAWVNHAIQEADLLMAFGMRFDDRVTGNLKTYAPTAKKIHVDIDASEINKNVAADVGIIGDLRETLKDLLDLVKPADHSTWVSHIDSMKGDAAVRDIQSLPDTGHLYAAHVINDIWRITDGNAVVVTDVGQHLAAFPLRDGAPPLHHRGEGEQEKSGRRRKIEHELAAGKGCINGDHVDREHRAAGRRIRLGAEPAFGGDEEAGTAESHECPKHRPQDGVEVEGMSQQGRGDERGKSRKRADMAGPFDQAIA